MNSRTALTPREAMMRGLTSMEERRGKREKIQTVTTMEIQQPKKVERAERAEGTAC